jgi:surface-anchored protein
MRLPTLAATWLSILALALLGASGPVAAADPASPTDPSPTAGEPGDDLTQRIDPDQGVATDEAVLERGHVDLGPRYLDGAWSLMVHDDTRRRGSVWRPLDRSVIRVLDTATQEVPDDPAYDFLGVDPGTPVHVVPQTQDPEVVWLGWNTQDPEVMERVDRGVTLSLVGVDGPGDLVVYLQDGGFGAPDVLWDSRSSDEQPLWVDVNTHTHANWVFTEPGVYLVSVEAAATLVDRTEETTTGTLRIAVGDDADTDEALTAPVPDAGGDTPTATDALADVDADEEGVDAGGPVLVPLAAGAAVLILAGGFILFRGRRTRTRALGGDEE